MRTDDQLLLSLLLSTHPLWSCEGALQGVCGLGLWTVLDHDYRSDGSRHQQIDGSEKS